MSRKLLRIGGGLLILILLMLTAAYWYITSAAFMSMAAEEGAAIAQEVLSTKVDIGKIEVQSINEVDIQDVAVYDKGDKLIAKIADVRVGFSYLSMLKNSVAEGISDVYLSGVEGDIHQRPDGAWNYEDLISEEPSESKFTGKVHLDDARLNFTYNGTTSLVEDLKAELDFCEYPAVKIQGEGKNQGASVKVSGNTGGSRQTFSIEALDVDLEKYIPFIPAGTLSEDLIKDIGGYVPKFVVSGEKCGEDIYYTGQAELTDGRVTILDTKVKDIKGLAVFNEKEAQIFMGAATSGQKANARGKVKLVNTQPILDITVTSDGFEPGVLIQDIPYTGPVAFSARVAGEASNPVVDADVKIAKGAINNYSFTNCSANVHYEDGAVAVENMDVDILGGHAVASGSFIAQSQSFAAKLDITDIDLAEAAEYVPALDQISGNGSAQLLLEGNADNLNDIKVVGNIQSNGVTYQGIEAVSVDGSFAYAKNALHMDFLSTKFAGGGEFGLQGDLTLEDQVDIYFYGANVDMSMIKKLSPKVDIYGFADMNGHVKGTVDDPKIRADFAAREGSIFSQPFDRLHGKAGGSLRGVKISGLIIEKGPDNRWTVDGVMGFAGEKRIRLKVSTQKARMENMLKAMDIDFPLTGSIDNEITITGSLENPQIVGEFSYDLGKYNDEFVIQKITGNYSYRDKQLVLENVDLNSPGIQAHIDQGTVTSDGQLDIKLEAKNINLDAFSNKLPAPAEGLFDFEGQLSGTLKSPYFHGNISSKTLNIRGEGFDDVAGSIDYRNHVVYFSDMYLKQNEGKYTLNAEYNINYNMLGGNIQIENGDIQSLGVMAGWENNKVIGELNGNFGVSGTLDNPSVNMAIYVVDGKLGEYVLDDVSCTGYMENRVVTITSLSGREGETGKFTAVGTVDLDGEMSISADISQVDAGAVAGAAGYDMPVIGKINSHVEAVGALDNPIVQADLTVTDLGVSGASMDSLTGKFLVKDRVISIVDKLVAQKQVGKKTNMVVVTGKMPIAALQAGEHSENAQFDLNISLEDADLSLLPTVSKYIDWAVGETGGDIKITGNLESPCFDGVMTVSDGAYKIKGVEKPVTDVAVKLLLTGNNIVLEKCTGKMGSGDYSIVGYVELDGLTPVNYHADVDLNKLEVKSSFYRGDLNCKLTVDSLKMPAEIIGDKQLEERVIPKITGNLVLKDVLLSTPSLPGDSSEMPEVALDFGVELDKGVRFISANLGDLRLTGGAHFSGTTLRPKTSGAIVVKKGTINYLKTTFQVVEGAVKFDRMDTLYPSISLRAGTKISKTRVFVSLSGPVEHMRFRLMSSPQMSEQEIIQLLTLRSEYDSNKSDASRFSSMLSVALQMTILSEVETAMRNVLNLDLFSIERDTAEFEDEKIGDKKYFEVYNVKMGKDLSDKLMIQYTKSINDSEYQAGFEYELTDNMSVTYFRSEKHANVFGIRAQYKFSTASARDDVDDERIYRDNMGYKSVRR